MGHPGQSCAAPWPGVAWLLSTPSLSCSRDGHRPSLTPLGGQSTGRSQAGLPGALGPEPQTKARPPGRPVKRKHWGLNSGAKLPRAAAPWPSGSLVGRAAVQGAPPGCCAREGRKNVSEGPSHRGTSGTQSNGQHEEQTPWAWPSQLCDLGKSSDSFSLCLLVCKMDRMIVCVSPAGELGSPRLRTGARLQRSQGHRV